MATEKRVHRLQNETKRLYGIREMKACILKEQPTQENLERYYQADDRMDAKLDELYAANVMLMQVEKQHLFELYTSYKKEQLKAKLLRRLTKADTEQTYYQLALSRLDALEAEKSKLLKRQPQKRARLRYVEKTITRLRAWTKDLNYENQKGKKKYKR